MRTSGGNKDRHWHWWVVVPVGDKLPDKHCRCGAVKYWNGKKWTIKRKTVTK